MPALKITQDFLLAKDGNSPLSEIKWAASIKAVLKAGSIADADLVCEHFLEDPAGFTAYELLQIVTRWGNSSHAAKIFTASFEKGELKQEVDPVVLEVIGNLRYEPAKESLAGYAFQQADYYLHAHASLGLLHLDCRDLEAVIASEIKKCLAKHLFPEFIPALVCKLTEREELLGDLFETGRSCASTDCNAGILLGFSRCGEEGKGYFLQALFDPAWEASSSATGSLKAALIGIGELKVSFGELLETVQKKKSGAERAYGLQVILSLLERSLMSSESLIHTQSFTEIYQDLYEKDEGLSALAEEQEMQKEAERLEELLRLKLYEEVLSEVIAGKFKTNKI